MSDYPTRYERPTEPAMSWATGFILFAGVMMVLSGSFQAFAGLVGIIQDEFYVGTRDYLLQLDATTWGWVHLVLGLIVVGAGFSLLAGHMLGRIIGVIAACLSAASNFAFIPHYPIWSLTIITLDIFVIWAITTHGGRAARSSRGRPARLNSRADDAGTRSRA